MHHVNEKSPYITIRRWQATDSAAICQLFHASINQLACAHYSEAQRQQWAHSSLDTTFWQQRLPQTQPAIAEVNGQIAGFVEVLLEDAYIDCLYVHPDFARQGVGQALLQQAINMALTARLHVLKVDVSLTAAPLFTKMGFQAKHENRYERNGVVLTNTRMEKHLLPI